MENWKVKKKVLSQRYYVIKESDIDNGKIKQEARIGANEEWLCDEAEILFIHNSCIEKDGR